MLAENASNLRRDLTAETSLMSDLDKRLNLEQEPRDRIYSAGPGSTSQKIKTADNKEKEHNESNSNNSLNNGSGTNSYFFKIILFEF